MSGETAIGGSRLQVGPARFLLAQAERFPDSFGRFRIYRFLGRIDAMVIRQSYRKLLLMLPPACLMFLLSALVLWISWSALNPLGIAVGIIAVGFFLPALLMLLQAAIAPSYLSIDDAGMRCRFYSVELSIPWDNIEKVTAGMGWPALTFHNPETVAATAKFHGLAPLGWLLSIPTKFVSLVLRRPMPDLYPATQKGLLRAFLASERGFGFHYGMPSSLLEKSNQEILVLLRRRGRGGR